MFLSNFSPRVARWRVAGDLTFPGKMQVVLRMISCWASKVIDPKKEDTFSCYSMLTLDSAKLLYLGSGIVFPYMEQRVMERLTSHRGRRPQKLMVPKKTLHKYCSSTLKWILLVHSSMLDSNQIWGKPKPELMLSWFWEDGYFLFCHRVSHPKAEATVASPNAEDDFIIKIFLATLVALHSPPVSKSLAGQSFV